MIKNQYWILTKNDAINYAKSLKASIECEYDLGKINFKYTYEQCLIEAKKQLKRNISFSNKELKILKLKNLIQIQEDRFNNDSIVRSRFNTLDEWFEHLGKIKLNTIFLKINKYNLIKLKNYKI